MLYQNTVPNNRFLCSVVRDRKAYEFSNLVQGSMSVIEYDTKFEEQSKYGPKIIPTGRDKTLKF